MVVVEGVARSLDPNINMWNVAKPIVENYIRENIGPKAFLKDFLKTIQVLSRVGPQLPSIIEALKDKLDDQSDEKVPSNTPNIFWLLIGSAVTILIGLVVYSI